MLTYERREGTWPFDPAGVQTEIRVDASDARPATILLTHPANPFVAEADIAVQAAVQRAAHAYLQAVLGGLRLALPEPDRDILQRWIGWLDPNLDPQPDFGWLPAVNETEDNRRARIGSRRVENGPGEQRRNRTLVLLASELLDDIVLGSEFGMRVVVHDMPQGDGVPRVRITGLSAALPFGDFRNRGSGAELISIFGSHQGFVDFLTAFRATIAATLGLATDSIFYRGFRVGEVRDGRIHLEMRGRGLDRLGMPAGTPYEFILDTRVGGSLEAALILDSQKVLLSSCGLPPAAVAPVFRADPASRHPPGQWRKFRPTRPEEVLAAERENVPVNVPLEIENRVRVLQTAYVPGDTPGAVKNVSLPSPVPPVRSNEFTAVSTYHNLQRIFDWFDQYGIMDAAYFEQASLPLEGHYRSGVRPGPGKDG